VNGKHIYISEYATVGYMTKKIEIQKRMAAVTMNEDPEFPDPSGVNFTLWAIDFQLRLLV